MTSTEQTTLKEDINSEQKINHPFYQIIPSMNIRLKPNTKIIKAKDSTVYFDAITLLEESKKALNDSKIEGLKIKSQAEERGYEEGSQKANNFLAEKNIETASAISSYLSTVEDKLSSIVFSVIRKIINEYDDTDYVTQSINSALVKFRKNQKITLHVHDSLIQEVSSRINMENYNEDTIHFIPDSTLNKKDCLVITELGIINATLEQQLKTIEDCLLELK